MKMQETILTQMFCREQSQEDIQLTELLPVKQSRIQENDGFADRNATDGLRALRSFSNENGEELHYGLRDLNFGGVSDKIHNIPQKRKDDGTSNFKSCSKGINKSSSRIRVEGGKVFRKRTKEINKKGVMCVRVSEDSVVTNVSGEAVETPVTTSEYSKGYDQIERDASFSEYKERNSVYLDLNKSTNNLRDEIYTFRYDVLDAYSVATSEGADTDSMNENEHSNEEEPLLKENDSIKSNDSILSPDATAASDSTEANSMSDTQGNMEKEFRSKINQIIEANALSTRQGNNVGQTKHEKNKRGCFAKGISLKSMEHQLISTPNLDKNNVQKRRRASRWDRKNGEDNLESDAQRKYCCVVCDARFKGSGGLRNHYKVVHGAGPVYKCDDCGKEFPLKERLKLHVRMHTGFKPYKCTECDKSFARGSQLVQHRRTHSQVKPYSCNLCSGTFTCAANLTLHMKRHNGQKDHKCEICGRGFVRRDALKKHLECLHRDVKSFLCNICNKTFKGHLPQHMRTHVRDRPHGCATCGQRFAQKSQLTVHQRTHSGQRPFRCMVCWQAFAHSTALKLHTRRHTGERPFKCAECNAGFTQLPHWKKHMKCIHGRNEPYHCTRCNTFFKMKNDLESHEKTCHSSIEDDAEGSNDPATQSESQDKDNPNKYRVMTVERMRLLLAVLLKRISRPEKLDELGFGKRLIDQILCDSLISAGKTPASGNGLSDLEILSKNLETFLQWTVPKEHWAQFKKLKKTPEDILEALTAT